MGIFAWPGANLTGCGEIDADHLPMLELLDQLHDAMVAGKGDRVVVETLDALAEHETAHFAREEKLMRLSLYPGLAEHRAHHRAMLKELRVLRRRARAGHMAMAFDTMRTMRRWLREHINGDDRAAADHIVRRFADKHSRGSVLLAG